MYEVSLDPIEETDLELLLGWRNDSSNQVYFREYRPLNQEHQLQWFESLTNNRNIQMFAITQAGRLIGACGLTNIDWIGRSAEVSLFVGHGYIDDIVAPEAFRQLEQYAEIVLGLNRLWAEIWDFDAQKQKLLVQRGYQLEVTKRQAHWHDGWHDALIYGRLLND